MKKTLQILMLISAKISIADEFMSEKPEAKHLFDASVGTYVSTADGVSTPGISLGAGVKSKINSYTEGTVRLEFLYDLTDKCTDPVKYPDWYKAQAKVESTPIKVTLPDGSIYMGAIIKAEGEYNTPSSVERRLTLSGGPLINYNRDNLRIKISTGYYIDLLEIDDDHPFKRGYETRGEILKSDGVFSDAEIEFNLGGKTKNRIAASAKCDLGDARLRELKIEDSISRDFSELFKSKNMVSGEIFAQYTRFDLGKDSDKLGFKDDLMLGARVNIVLGAKK